MNGQLKISCWELREFCIENNYFTNGTNEQYEKFFTRNDEGASINELATLIWICSSNDDRETIISKLITKAINK